MVLALGGLIALAAAMGIGRFVYTPILPFMFSDLGLSKGEGGLIASANYAGYLLGALVAASPSLLGSRRAWLLGSLAVSALSTAAVGLVATVPAFMALRFVGGAASAFVLLFASVLILERLREAGRSALSSLHFAGVGSGIAVSAVIVSGLAAFDVGWRGQWIVSGLVSLAAVVAVALMVPNRDEPPGLPAEGRGGRGFALLAAAYGLFGFGYVITATFLVAIVRGAEEIRPLEPVVWLVVGGAAAPSVAIWSWIAGKTGALRALAAACALQAVGIAASVLWVSAPGVMLASALLGGTIMGITALGLAAARLLTKGDPRRAMAMITASFGVGQIIGPVFAGYMHDLSGSFLSSSLAASAALAVAAALALRAHKFEIADDK